MKQSQTTPPKTLDRMARRVVSRMSKIEHPWRSLRHRSAFRYTALRP
jgi:hypothetical protein